MNCPYCGRVMSDEGVFKYCKGKLLRGHPWIQFTALDGSFQTKSAKLARWFAENGFRVNAPPSGGDMFDMYPRR